MAWTRTNRNYGGTERANTMQVLSASMVGKLANYQPVQRNKMAFTVAIVDVRNVYGRYDALITPVDGSGEAWVSLDALNVRAA